MRAEPPPRLPRQSAAEELGAKVLLQGAMFWGGLACSPQHRTKGAGLETDRPADMEYAPETALLWADSSTAEPTSEPASAFPVCIINVICKMHLNLCFKKIFNF